MPFFARLKNMTFSRCRCYFTDGLTASSCLIRLISSVALLASGPMFAASTNVNTFGFSGPEIFPIDSQISQLRVADLDGDGLNDLIVVNNARAKINLLYNQTGKTNLAKSKPAIKRE